jgi:uncharacterized low-complexity protein
VRLQGIENLADEQPDDATCHAAIGSMGRPQQHGAEICRSTEQAFDQHIRRSNMQSGTHTLALALAAAVGTTGIAHASGNPFSLNGLSQGYQVAAADATPDRKLPEGKHAAKNEVRPADQRGTGIRKAKTKDGKCGEGKCGTKKWSHKHKRPGTIVPSRPRRHPDSP